MLFNMFFLLKGPKSNIDLNKEFKYNYTILCEISNKYISDILSAVWRIHSYEYMEFLTMPLKNNNDEKKSPKFDFGIEKDTSYKLLKNLDIDRELIENYKYLEKLLKNCNKNKSWYEIIKNIISCISVVHSNSYMSNLAEIAIEKNSEIAEMIYEQLKNENQIIREIKDKFIKKYNTLVDYLYSWKAKWIIYNIEKKLYLLQKQLIIIFWENSDITSLCRKVIDDISIRWEEICINPENNNRWHFDGDPIEH